MCVSVLADETAVGFGAMIAMDEDLIAVADNDGYVGFLTAFPKPLTLLI